MPSKQKIPATVRNSVWNMYIGEEIKIGLCYCCATERISTANFECGHIQSKARDGNISIQNLRPICGICNKSMGTQKIFECTKDTGRTIICFEYN